jgi:hypothetical protein
MKRLLWWFGAALIALLSLVLVSLLSGAYIVAATEQPAYAETLARADLREASHQELAALQRFPMQAPVISATFGDDPTFQRMLYRFGHNSTYPVIWKCLTEGDDILDASYAMLASGRELMSLRLPQPHRLSDIECGKHAIAMIDLFGHDFLRLYALDQQEKAHGLPAKAAIALVGDLLTSGIKNFEKRKALGEEIRVRDWVFLGGDILIVGGPAAGVISKFSRLGKAGTVAKEGAVGARIVQASSGTRTLAVQVAPRLTAKYAITAAKYTAAGGIVYMAWWHPDVVTGYAGSIAEWLGYNKFFVQAVVWAAIIGIFLLLTSLIWVPMLTGLLVLLRVYRLVRA